MWTRTPPTEPGWYWHRDQGLTVPVYFHGTQDDGSEGSARAYSAPWDLLPFDGIEGLNGEWMPLSLPS